MSLGIDASSALSLVIWKVVMLNEPVLSEVEGVKHLAIAREILRGVYPRAQRLMNNPPSADKFSFLKHFP